MIKANELRIGNWVNSNYRKKYKQVTPSDLSTTADDGKIDYIEPIPLTPEILEKAGFVKDELFGCYTLNWLSIKSNGIYWYMVNLKYTTTYNISNPIKHLHQLQNLYYALTGEELEINL